MIESGTHTPGVSAADFRLPSYTALRFERPDPRLADYITNNHVLDSEGPEAFGAVNYMLPSWPAIRIVLAANPIALTIGGVTHDPLPVASLYGTTTRAMRMTTHGGVSIGAGISPLGWSRLFKKPADRFRDRIVPLDTVLDPALVTQLVATLRASDQGPAVKRIFDDFLLDNLRPPSRHEPALRALMRLIKNDETEDLTSAAQRIGIDPARLRRLSTRHFGFPPKTLLMRTRFIRSFLKMHAAGDAADYSLIASTYFDASHFLRDAKRFLGMTPRRFMAMDMPYLDATIRATPLRAHLLALS
jgi:AraC-like DNA-binding protein